MMPLDKLVRLSFGELDPDEETRVEEHLLGCSECAATLVGLVALGDALAAIFRSAGPTPPIVLTPRLRSELERAGLVTRTYSLRPGEIVPCTVDALDRFVLTELSADLEDVTQVDLTSSMGRITDVAFDARRGVVDYVVAAESLRSLPSLTITLRLLAVEGDGERVLGDYTLEHTAFAG